MPTSRDFCAPAPEDLGLREGFVVSNAAEPGMIGEHIRVIPWAHIASREFDFGFGRSRRGAKR